MAINFVLLSKSKQKTIRFLNILHYKNNMANTNITLSTIYKEIELIKNKVINIEDHMVDVDTILTPEENKELNASIKRYKEGKTKDFNTIKDELGL